MTDFYHYAVITKPEADHRVDTLDSINMENVDYKRQPDVDVIRTQIERSGGLCCGIIRGGQFGLATNQIAAFSCWDSQPPQAGEILSRDGNRVSGEQMLLPTVRPLKPQKMERDGIYVIRWIRMLASDISEYTQLCLETWPRFESATQSCCYGVFRPVKDESTVKILMLTWYASFSDWEQSRTLDPRDLDKWARRSEMELSHWAEAGRLAI